MISGSLYFRKLALCLSLFVFATFGCVDSPEPPAPVGSTPWYPLQIGNKWIFRGGDQKLTLRVAKHERIDGVPCALVQTLQNGEIKTEEHIFVTDEGVFGMTSGGEKLPAPFPLLRLPPRDGRTWSVRITKNRRQSRVVHVLGRDEISVPAGTFSTITLRGEKYVGGQRRQGFVWWLAKDIGIVKQKMYTPTSTSVFELVEFHVAGRTSKRRNP